MSYELIIYNHEEGFSSIDNNVDVEIRLDNKTAYTATFFTVENIKSLLKQYENTGECANGLYLWSINMIVVKFLSWVYSYPRISRVSVG